ncbi:dystroglycan [Rhopalosiphum maidis]|uniref:dystroglycan n=1 Tax=Rhopalosiphum maidis TaxID=43146 RepID=UPI000EFDB440|nr:dystroglycan [Rhopalosiphum maidis]XP_026809475.1 dystroglycan [Rhopalosiphum maidis]
MKGLAAVAFLLCLASAHKSGDVKHKWWSIPEPVATVGKLFYFKIPHDSVIDNTGPVDFVGQDGGGLPSWLVQGKGELEGIPGPEDVRDHLLVRAGDKSRRIVSDVASIRVAPLKWKNVRNNKRCKNSEDSILLCLVIGMNFKSIQPLQRLIALKNLAGFLSLPQDAVLLVPQESVSSWLIDYLVTSERQSHKKHQFNDTSFVLWEVGCGGDISPEHIDHVRQMQSNTVDGTLSEVLQLPVTSWRLVNSLNPLRGRRQVAGAKQDTISGNVKLDDYDDTKNVNTQSYNDDDEEEEEIIPDTRQLIIEPSPSYINHQYDTDHYHRHHRRDESVLNIPKDIINSTPVQNMKLPSTLDLSGAIESFAIQPTPSFYESKSSTPTTEQLSESVVMGDSYDTTIIPDESMSTETPNLGTDKLKDLANENSVSTSTTTTTTTNGENPNTSPIIKHKLPKLAITAGKPFKYPIPNNIFYDAEDGDVKHLKLALLNADPTLLSWVEFDAEKQILLALPLEDHVSKWEVVIEAKDSGNLTVNNTLELVVQQLPHLRAINHQLTLQLRLKQDSLAWTHPVNWSLDIIDRISTIYSTNVKDITVLDWPRISVLAANKDKHSFQFTWTNDTLPREVCPNEQITQILGVLKPEKGNKMKSGKQFGPSVVLEDFSWQGLGNCASTSFISSQNYQPVLRNPVDLINATYGQLLSYVVPVDTFYDPEDGSSRRLKLSLMTIDRTQVPENNWLQFDTKNQEFYGIPLWGEKILSEYQLICTDREGRSNHDSLVVSIPNTTKPLPSAEFDMIFKTPEFKEFNNSAKLKKLFVERVANLFKDKDTANIVVLGISSVNGMTMVTWYNKTLEMNRCEEEKVLQLRQVLLNEDEKLSENVTKNMKPSFNVVGAHVIPSGICEGGFTVVRPPKPPNNVTPRDDNILLLFDTSDQYFSTFIIPAIIILAMMLFAGLLACLLYRRRPSSKLRIGDDERQSFRSRGIPVIFQDELDERLEPTNKTPIIMREEKPPLPPPEYQRSPPMATTALLADTEDSPYQPPPPPFSNVGSNHRSKPSSTPSYRKPPPYVPP